MHNNAKGGAAVQLNSFAFFGFFAAVFALWWGPARRWRQPLLFAASVFFYALFGLPAAALLLGCELFCWGAGLLLARRPSRPLLALCLALVLAPLFLFKYLAFFAGGLSALTQAVGGAALPAVPSLLQPLGISYTTFLMVSYLVDIYRGTLAPEKNFFLCAASLSLFLQVTAGPLTLPRELLPQLRGCPSLSFDCGGAVAGAQLVLLGLFKKIVVADALSYYTSAVYADPRRLYGLSFAVAALFYTVQIYADFSGYTDMARGFAGLLGLRLAPNFDAPYLSRTVKEFWGRWHISLSAWLKEYVYIPLGGNRVSRPRYYFNLFATFVLSGLWHGARLTMLCWGALHGLYQVVGAATRRPRERLRRALHIGENAWYLRLWQTVFTFVLVSFAWIFFGAPDMATALTIVRALPVGFAPTLAHIKDSLVLLGLTTTAVLRFAVLFAALLGLDLATRDIGWERWIRRQKPWVQLALCWLLAAGLVLWGNLGGGSFMYFQF